VGTRWRCLDCPPKSEVDLCQDCIRLGFRTSKFSLFDFNLNFILVAALSDSNNPQSCSLLSSHAQVKPQVWEDPTSRDLSAGWGLHQNCGRVLLPGPSEFLSSPLCLLFVRSFVLKWGPSLDRAMIQVKMQWTVGKSRQFYSVKDKFVGCNICLLLIFLDTKEVAPKRNNYKGFWMCVCVHLRIPRFALGHNLHLRLSWDGPSQ